MNINANLVFWIFLTSCQVLTDGQEQECVQRRLGACKVLYVGKKNRVIRLDKLHSPPPDGFAFKTSLEINLVENKHSFENNLPVERKRLIGYNLDNAALATIKLDTRKIPEGIRVHLGKKYYRLAEFQFSNVSSKVFFSKYSRYTPSLPTFPYILHLEMTTNGTFSIYADANTEPFLKHQFTERVNVRLLSFEAPESQTDLIAFVDCSVKYKRNCGSHQVDRLYGCREWLVSRIGYIRNFDAFQKTHGKDVIFDEFIVVDTEYSSKMEFRFDQHNLLIAPSKCTVLFIFAISLLKIYFRLVLQYAPDIYFHKLSKDNNENRCFLSGVVKQRHLAIISLAATFNALLTHWSILPEILKKNIFFEEFKVNSSQATLQTKKYHTIKSARTQQWFEVPESPYAVRVLITTGANNSFLTISNLRNNTIISLNFCEDIGSLQEIYVVGPRLYFDCLHFDNVNSTITNERPKKIAEKDSHWFKYHENGYNYTKTLLDTRQFVKEPFVIYQHAFENTTKDWCKEEPTPTLPVTSKYDNDSLHAVIERSNAALLSKLEKVADTNTAVLTVLQNISAQNNAAADSVLSELKSVEALIVALATHLEQNATSVNYNYNNKLNVTEFLKQN